MESAKAAVSKFLGKSGHHDTTVDETVQPTVISETIKPTQHENITEVVDREVHQDHYHTTVQPLQHQEVLLEKHVHQQMPVEELVFNHADDQVTKQRLATEAAKFQNTTSTAPTQSTHSELPVATGEHIHHHVHEMVQPVVHKETVVPEVVHTTIPIHEKHIAHSEMHGISVLSTKSLDAFQQQGGSVAGSEPIKETYEGAPRPYDGKMQLEREPTDVNPTAHYGMHDLERTGHSRPGSSNAVGPSAQTSALAGARSLPSETASGIRSTERVSAVGGSTGAENETLAGADAAAGSTFGGGGAFHTDPIGDHSGLTAPKASTVQHFRDDPTSADQTRGRANRDTSGGVGSRELHSSSNIDNIDTDKMSNEQPTEQVKDDAPQEESEIKGRDPNTEGPDHPQLKGTGAPGSHSAFFGLTPDGKKDENTKAGSTPPVKSSEGEEGGETASGGGTFTKDDGGSRGVTGHGVADQMHDPKVGESGKEGEGGQGVTD